MSGLLKAEDRAAQSGVRPLEAACTLLHEGQAAERPSAAPAPAGNQFSPAPALQEGQPSHPSIELEATIAELRRQLRQAGEEAEQREEAGYERGLREGRAEALEDGGKRMALLAEVLEEMRRNQADRLAEHEVLALQLARVALKRILGEGHDRDALLAETLRHHLGGLRRELVQNVRVSPEDFASDEALAALAGQVPGIAIERDASLRSGECIADLKLGQLDIGLPGQWRRLTEFFDRLAEEEREP